MTDTKGGLLSALAKLACREMPAGCRDLSCLLARCLGPTLANRRIHLLIVLKDIQDFRHPFLTDDLSRRRIALRAHFVKRPYMVTVKLARFR